MHNRRHEAHHLLLSAHVHVGESSSRWLTNRSLNDVKSLYSLQSSDSHYNLVLCSSSNQHSTGNLRCGKLPGWGKQSDQSEPEGFSPWLWMRTCTLAHKHVQSLSMNCTADACLRQATACLSSRATTAATSTAESRTFQHNHMSETGIYVICQYGIKIDLTDKKVSLREANEANMKTVEGHMQWY